jgi:hypothetical protein
MPFAVAMSRRMTTNHHTDCHFSIVLSIQKGMAKINLTVEYPNISLNIRPGPPCEGLPIPELPDGSPRL